MLERRQIVFMVISLWKCVYIFISFLTLDKGEVLNMVDMANDYYWVQFLDETH